jgi:hypothetical protein
VADRQAHELYTHALQDPQVLVDVQEFPRWNHHLLLDNTTSKLSSPRPALLVACRVDRKALCVVFAATGLSSMCGGFAVGFVLGRVDLGIAISSLFAAILSTMEVLLVWFQAS